MLLSKGLWLGKGRIRPSGISLGDEVEADVQVSEDDEGISLSGAFSGAFNGTFSIRIAPDETGTYVVDARVGAFALEGMGKLESEPNLCLLWNEGGTQKCNRCTFCSSSRHWLSWFFARRGADVDLGNVAAAQTRCAKGR